MHMLAPEQHSSHLDVVTRAMDRRKKLLVTGSESKRQDRREEGTGVTGGAYLAGGDVNDEPSEKDDLFLVGSQILALKSRRHDVHDDKVARCGHDDEDGDGEMMRW